MLPFQSIPNMVIARVGAGGKVSIFNRFGTTHVVADVLGCFRPSAGGRFVAVTPTRLLDTRVGTGAPTARVAQTPVPLRVAGVQGVPSAATAALLNVTAVLPTVPTFVTVYPGDAARPLASNLNAVPEDIVPNMVVARLGRDGTTMLYNSFGTIDLVTAFWLGLAAALLIVAYVVRFAEVPQPFGMFLYERRSVLALIGVNMVAAAAICYIVVGTA